MKEHITKGLIRKITIGDLKTGMSYLVGQNVMRGEAIITDIIEDEAYFREYNIIRYGVYVKKIVMGIYIFGKILSNNQQQLNII